MAPPLPQIDALVVESDPLAAELLQRGLEDLGFTVSGVAEWADAWEHLQRRIPRLIVAPLAAETGAAPTGIRRLRGLEHGRRAVLLATHARTVRPDRQAMLNSGIDDFLAYPIDPDELELRLAIARARVLERQAVDDPLSAHGGIHQAMARSDEATVIAVLDEPARAVRVISVNGAFERLTGYSGNAVTGRTHRVLVDAKDSEALLQCLRESAQQKRAASIRVHGLRQDGRSFPVEWSITPIPSDRAEPSTLLCILRPGGSSADWMQQLRAAEEKFRNLVDVSLQGVLVHKDWNLRFVNRTLAELLGYPDAEAVLAKGRLEALIAPDHQKRLQSYNESRKRGHAPEHYELEMLRRDGSRIALEGFVRQVLWEGESAVLASYVDVTERKRAQTELQSSKALLQTVFDALPHNVFVKDRHGVYLAINRALSETWQRSASEIVGQRTTSADPIPPDEAVAIESSDRVVLENGLRSDTIIPRSIPHLGTRRFRTIKVPVRDADGNVTGLVGISEDVTERMDAEEELRQSRALLQAVFDTIPHDVFVKNRQRQLVAINAAMGRTWQRPPESIPAAGLQIAGTSPPDERKVIDTTDRQVLEQGLAVDQVIHRTMLSGDVRQVRLIKRPLRDADGAIVGLVGLAEDITERLVAEEGLRRSQALLHAIFDTIPHGLFMKDREGRFLIVNRPLSSRWGLQPEDMIGERMGMSDRMKPEEEQAVLASDERVLRTGENDEYTMARTLSDGSVRQIRYVKAPLRDGSGAITGIVGVAEDITERLHNEEELRQSRALFQTTFDTIPSGVYVKDREGRYVLVNRAFSSWWGIPPQALVGGKFAPFPNRSATEVDAVLAMDREVFATGRILERVLTTTLPTGVRNMRVAKVPLRNAAGEIVGLVGIDEDITEQLSARDALQRSQALLQTVFDAIPHQVFVKDAQERYVTVNRAFVRSWGGSPTDYVGLQAVESPDTPPEEMARVRSSDQALLATGVGIDEELTRTTPVGLQHHRVIKAPVWDPDGRVVGLVGIAENISERKRSEEALRQSEERYRRLIEESPYGILIHRNGGPLYVNPAFARIFGYDSPTEVLALDSINYWVADEELARVRGYADSRLHHDMSPPETYEFRGKRKDGTLIWVQNSVRAVDWEGQRALQATMMDVTERKTAEAALAASQRLLRTLIDTLPQSIHVKDVSGRYQVVNQAMARTHAIAADKLLGQTIATTPLFERNQVTVVQSAEEQAMREDRQVEIPEMQLQRPDGAVAWERLIQVPLHDAAGNVVGVVGVAEDITARKNAEDELRDNQRLLKTVFDTLPQSLSLKDSSGRYVLVNQAFLKRNNVTAEQVYNKTPEVLPRTATEQARVIQTADAEVIAKGTVVELPEMRFGLTDSTYTWVRIIKAPFRDSTGRVSGIVSIAEDLTSRRLAEDKLRDSQRLLQTVMNALPQSIYVKDLKGTYQLVNNAVIQRHGLSAPAILDHTAGEISAADPEAAERIRQGDATVLQTGNMTEVGELRVSAAKHPAVWMRVIKTPLRNDQGNIVGIITIADDITARKQAEVERLELERQILHSQKLESLGVLAGGIAHDFNNLLTGILGNVELAVMDTSADHPAAQTLQQIKQASLRAAALTQQMLAYSGRGRLQIRPVDLSALVEEMAQLLKVSISKKIAIQFDLARDLPAVEGDPTQMQQIVMNLITNASEAIGDVHGAIHLSTGRIRADRPYLASAYLADALEEGEYVYMEVSDTGTGMDAEVQARIFDPFFTTKFTGRGLGLAAVLGIVRSHHGTIHIQSTPGKGSTFRVLFPATVGVTRPVRALQEPAPSTWRGAGTILVVDDEPIVRSVLQRQLKSLGFEVISAEGGRAALTQYQKNPNAIAVVLLDMTMPDMGGVETLRELKRIRPDVHVVVCSGYSEQDAVEQFRDVEPDGFLQKPTQFEDLTRKLQEVLG